MLPQYAIYRRKALQARTIALATVSGLALTIFVLPKPEAYAAPGRLAMTVGCFVLSATGLAVWITLRRRAVDAWLAFRYQGASSPLTTTVAYLNDERRKARHGVLPALVAAISFQGLNTAAMWPQFAALVPYRDLFGPCAAGAVALAVLAPLARRKHLINALYLRQTLRLMAKQVGFRPRTIRDARQLAAELARPAVSRATATGFRAGGFDWKIEDDLQKNAIVFGQTGSGKTVAVLVALLESMLATSAASGMLAAGLILDPKGSLKSTLEKLAVRYGREADIVVLSASDYVRPRTQVDREPGDF